MSTARERARAECYNLLYHAAQHKQEEVAANALKIVRAVLSLCPQQHLQQFYAAMLHAIGGVKEQRRKAVLVDMAANLVFEARGEVEL